MIAAKEIFILSPVGSLYWFGVQLIVAPRAVIRGGNHCERHDVRFSDFSEATTEKCPSPVKSTRGDPDNGLVAVDQWPGLPRHPFAAAAAKKPSSSGAVQPAATLWKADLTVEFFWNDDTLAAVTTVHRGPLSFAQYLCFL